jgi:hypothetical protein
MRLTALSMAALILAQPAALLARAATAGPPIETGDIEHLRSALTNAQRLRGEAAADKTRAYRQAHVLYRDCAKELRVFCLLSAQKIMRDADFAYADRERREFGGIAMLIQAIADLEKQAKGSDAARR